MSTLTTLPTVQPSTHPLPSYSIISVTTYSAVLSSPDAQRDKLTGAKAPKRAATSSGPLAWIMFFFGLIGKLFLAFVVFAIGVQIYKWWIMRQTNQRIAANFGPGSKYGAMFADGKRF